ncbi:hypothetical protein EDC01DRAFT_642662 [Geopyxis carbonaria]|nr:hypothetical protein EDC01DRAFT_642662 [Geopyxis carbonaria]
MTFGLFSKSYDPASDMPDQSGKTFIVTGGNTGLGYEAILAFVKKGAHVIMAARSTSKAKAATESIKKACPSADIVFLPLDLSDFSSIRVFAESVKKNYAHIDVLVNNAGVMALPYSTTAQGQEIQFGTNHMGHYYLTRLLLPLLLAAPAPRVVNLSSAGHNIAWRGLPTLYPNPLGTPTLGQVSEVAKYLEGITTYERYGISKLANLLHAKSLALKYPKLVVVSCHPGVIVSNLYESFIASSFLAAWSTVLLRRITISVKTGALNQIWCATVPATEIVSGKYYVPVGRLPGWLEYSGESRWAKNEQEAERLWWWSDWVCDNWEKRHCNDRWKIYKPKQFSSKED